jgi:hypothetical protein
MDRTSAQAQVKLSSLRSFYLKRRPQLIRDKERIYIWVGKQGKDNKQSNL